MYRKENMNKKLALQKLKERYFRPVEKYPNGHFNHHGDCNIFQAIEVYGFAPCSCGLIHDLRWFPEELSTKVYPKFRKDRVRSESVWHDYDEATHQYVPPKPIPQEEVDKLMAVLKAQGMLVVDPATYQKENWQIQQQEAEDWAVIEEVFGKEYADRCKNEFTTLKTEV